MNLLVTGAWQGYECCKVQLEEAGHTLAFLQWEKDPLPVDPEWVEGIICNGLFLHHPIEQFKNLKYIQLTSAGFDRVPMDYIESKGIEIHNARGVYSIPMAEFVLSGVLQFYKQAKFFHKNQQERKWEKNRNLLELYGKTVGIIGCGSIGTECAKRFQAFGCKVIGIATSKRKQEYFVDVTTMEHLREVLSVSDILVLTIPLTEDTKYLIGEEEFNAMNNSAILVNVARGALVDERALDDALENKEIEGAVLDVFEQEPIDDHRSLWNRENVLISPHNSFVGENNQGRLNDLIVHNLLK